MNGTILNDINGRESTLSGQDDGNIILNLDIEAIILRTKDFNRHAVSLYFGIR